MFCSIVLFTINIESVLWGPFVYAWLGLNSENMNSEEILTGPRELTDSTYGDDHSAMNFDTLDCVLYSRTKDRCT